MSYNAKNKLILTAICFSTRYISNAKFYNQLVNINIKDLILLIHDDPNNTNYAFLLEYAKIRLCLHNNDYSNLMNVYKRNNQNTKDKKIP